MRQYFVDEISADDVQRISEHLTACAQPAPMQGLFWVDLPEDILSPSQYSHKGCKPFCFSIEVGDDFVKFEFLIRSRQTLRCDCIEYANKMQRDFIMNFADNMLSDKNIRT